MRKGSEAKFSYMQIKSELKAVQNYAKTKTK